MNPATTRLSRRLLIFQEARNPSNMSEIVYLPVNKLGLPICGSGPELPSILELPLRILRAFTEIFNQPKYKGCYPALQMEYLLLIFRKWPETETYWLINRPGLPVSRHSPLVYNIPSDPILIPELLASLTETLTSDLAVYMG
ncbi:hypothetical protein ACP6JE_000326 [Aspergillus fumigatus]